MTGAAETPELLSLEPRELLTTTRTVRQRLDFTRAVPRELLVECVRDALQAPSASNEWPAQFLAVHDPTTCRRLGDLYRASYDRYKTLDGIYIGSVDKGAADRNDNQQRTARSADYLGEHMGDAPAIVVGAVKGRFAGPPAARIPLLGSAMPAMWSFMLAARLRGLGTAWTATHLMSEPEFNDILGIPGDEVTTFCMSPVAFTLRTDFRPAMRPDPSEVLHWNRWGGR